jgi:starvation-inducible outer membrane lipoprotein
MGIAALLLTVCLSAPAMAQDRYQSDAQDQATPFQQSRPETQQGESAQSAAGQTGQRQTREEIAAELGIEPMGRINSRIQSRVQSRIRNRIDRYYDPQANATSPFAVASDQARTAGRPRR